jgi:dehydrodolichyl diphosphate syntase complex subunit NUS1
MRAEAVRTSSFILCELAELILRFPGSSATLVEGELHTTSSFSPSSFTLNLVSRSFGRPQLARVAQRLASERKGANKVEELSSEAVSAILDGTFSPPLASRSSPLRRHSILSHTPPDLTLSPLVAALPLSEPDLLFVFGGPYLRLQGFPPWQIRLTEM